MKKETEDEHYWIEAFRNGDEKALAHFFDIHHKALCYFCNRLIDNNAEAQDIVAECFVKIWQRQHTFETARSIKAFLYITSRNACLDYLKQLKRRTTRQEDYFRQLEVVDITVLNHVVESEFLSILHQEVALLPDQCRKVFSLIYFEGKKTDEIAELMDLSIKTVRNHKARAIELLHHSFLKKGVSDALTLAIFIFLNKK
ncbi:RNA polymerase sigma-70 factor (ECF subfamily) [Pedobacter sp. AK017]|uniref:RNA polymerase sigma factor n=1 Tax=Pedobacter sp. AK017 TaxID=2723073 RepID=UPI0016198420|nr:RNA polymerase sigma-70 factor [Pedobacter sp. AK017]MBB5440663.1 RNA polymerase sigma-70 factor (ECF subfamily) [Pedobacter sp. AK017]